MRFSLSRISNNHQVKARALTLRRMRSVKTDWTRVTLIVVERNVEVDAAALVGQVLVGLKVLFVVWWVLKITPFALRRNDVTWTPSPVGHNCNCHQKC